MRNIISKFFFTLLVLTMGIGQMWGTNPADTVTVHSPGKIAGTNLVSAYGHSYEVFFSDNASLTQLLVGSNTSTTTQATGENKWCCVGASCGNTNNSISTAFSIGEFACNVKTSNHKALRVQSTAQTAKVVAMVVSGYDSIATLDKDEVQLYAEVWDATKEEYGAQTKLTATKTTTVSSHNKRAYALDASKRYRLTIAYGTSGSTNKTLYGFSLCIPASGPSVSAFSPATGATVKSGTTVTVTGSTGSTIYYKWATSTQTADDIYNGGSGSHGTAEAATVTSSGINSANGTTLYAIARKGTTNSAVASASYTIDDTAPTFSSSTPANSATGVATSGTIVLTFSEALASVDGSKFTLTGATKGTVVVDGTDATKVNVPYSGAANSATVTLSVAAEAVEDALGNKSAALSDIAFTTVAAVTPVCPSGMSISGTAAYTEGQTITLNAALSAGNGDITYTWYKGTDLATAKSAGSIGTGTSYTKANCVAGDAGNYWCEATKDECTPASNAEAYAVTVEEKTCPTSGVVYTMTMKSKSLSGVTQYTEVGLVEGDYATETGGVAYLGNNNSTASKAQIKTEAGGIVYFDGNDAYIKIALECPLQPGDLIEIEGNASSTELKYIISKTNSRSANVTSTNTSGTKKYYTVVADDLLDGESNIYFWREGSSGNKNIHSITITRPYNVSFVSAKGSAPSATTGFEVELAQITGVSGWTHTGWTADQAVTVGGEPKTAGTTLTVDATAVLSANTTFTAVWEQTYSVTYKANNGTAEEDVVHATESTFAANMFTAPEGKIFNGWNTSATGEGASYAVGAAVTATTTVYAQWIIDPTIRLIKADGSLNTVDFASVGGTLKDDKAYAVDGRDFAKYVLLSGTYTSDIVGNTMQTKYIIYDTQSDETDITLYLYNTNNNAKNLYYQIIKDGAAVGEKQSVSITSKENGQTVVIPTIEHTKKTRIVFCVESTNILFCQIEVLENGTALAGFGENGYQLSIPGRPASTSKLTNIDGFEIKSYNDLKMGSGTDYLALRGVDGSTYVTFTTASNIQLQVTTANANKFYVCAANIGTSSDKQYGGEAGTHNVNLLAGTYYIVPTAGSSGGEVQITKLAFATAPATVTVTFNSNEGSAVAAQELFSGDKAVEPTAPTKSGYRFVEWQLSGSAYDFDATVTANITLDAVWQQVWTVTFNSNGGSDVDAAVVDNGATVAAPDPAPTKSGFDFVEWRKEGESVAYNFATAVTANITLVAQWEVAQDDASLSALSYNSNAIDVNSAEEVAGVQTYTVHLQYGSSIDPALISVTKNAESANMSVIAYDSENKRASFMVTSGNGLVSINYAIQFVIDAKRGTSIVKAVISGGNQTAGFDATGIYGDKGYANTRNDKKVDTGGKFVGVKLLAGKTFAAGDKLFVVTSTDADRGYIEIYEEAAGTNLIKATGVRDASEGIEVAELAGYSEFYIVRKESDGDQAWNGTVNYVEVTREMAPAIKSFKFGDDAATINEGAKTITIEVPFSTDVTALTPTVEAYGNNGATYTPSGATDFTSPVDYVVTDAYSEFSTTYAVTVTKAAASTNADLASLAVAGYSLDFDPATTSYNVVLEYGTTVLPAITYEVAEVGLATAVKAEGGVSGATTITVTPEAGALYNKVYTINFSVSTIPTFQVFDGRTMTAAVVSFTDPTTEMTWTSEGAATSSSGNTKTINGRTYTKSVKIFGSATAASRYLKFTVPTTHVAKFYLAGSTNSSTGEETLFFAKELTADPAKAIAGLTASVDDPKWVQTDYLIPGEYYFCVTGSARIYELSVTLYPIDYSRNVTEGRFGTICLPNGGVMVGADLYEVAYYGETSKKIFFDEILSGVMEAGVPYVFLPQEGVNKLAVVYTDDADAAATNRNGLVGFIGANEDAETSVPEGMYILQNNQYREVLAGADARIKSYRAYINLGAITPTAPALAPGRRRISMGVASENSATGMDELNASETPVKMMIDGQLYILRGEKLYDATGRLVK